MKVATINLSFIEDVNKFYNVISKKDFDIDLARGRHCVDAKSIMGIYSFDLSQPIDLRLHCETDEYNETLSELETAGISIVTRE